MNEHSYSYNAIKDNQILSKEQFIEKMTPYRKDDKFLDDVINNLL